MGLQIAIDGPVAAGKSTVAKLLADKYDLVYIDTGSMYRAVAWKAESEGIGWEDEAGVTDLAASIGLELCKPGIDENDGRTVTVLVDGIDVSALIRTSHIGEGASVVSTYGGVREVLVAIQQNMAAGESVVMEGRDIGTRVLPYANLKIFMTATESERIERKWQYHQHLGHTINKKEVSKALKTRDSREAKRKVDPLRPATDAWVLNTSGLSIKQVLSKIASKVDPLLRGN